MGHSKKRKILDKGHQLATSKIQSIYVIFSLPHEEPTSTPPSFLLPKTEGTKSSHLFSMACSSISNHIHPFLQFQSRNPKSSSPRSLPIIARSSQSQIYGLKLSTLANSSPLCVPPKSLICAKVFNLSSFKY